MHVRHGSYMSLFFNRCWWVKPFRKSRFTNLPKKILPSWHSERVESPKNWPKKCSHMSSYATCFSFAFHLFIFSQEKVDFNNSQTSEILTTSLLCWWYCTEMPEMQCVLEQDFWQIWTNRVLTRGSETHCKLLLHGVLVALTRSINGKFICLWFVF